MLTRASPADLPPLGELLADDLFWRYLSGDPAAEGLPASACGSPRALSPAAWPSLPRLAGAASVTESAGRIWAVLAGRFGPSLVLLGHSPAPETGEGQETLDLVRIGAGGSPH